MNTEVTFVETPKRQFVIKEGWVAKKSDSGNPKEDKLLWFILDEFDYLSAFTDEIWKGCKQSKLKICIPVEGVDVKFEEKPTPQLVIQTKRKKTFVLYGRSTKELTEWKDLLCKSRDQTKSYKTLISEWESDETLKPFVSTLQGDLEDVEFDYNEFIDWKSVFVETLDGRKFPLAKIVGQKITLVILLRQLGCPLARAHLDFLQQWKKEFDNLGVQIVLIGIGTPQMGKDFKRDTKYVGSLFLDPQRQLYRAFNCRSGIKYVLNAYSKEAVRKVLNKGFKIGTQHAYPSQLGGVFVITQDDGLLYESCSFYAGDLASFDPVLKICKEYVRKHPNDFWTSKPRSLPKRLWPNVLSENPERKKDSPISCKEEAEWNLELGRNGVVYGSPDLEIEDAEEDTLFYKQYFYEHDHANYIGALKDTDIEDNAFAISILNEKSNNEEPSENKKVIFRNKFGTSRLVIPNAANLSEKEMLQYIVQKQFAIKEKDELNNVKILRVIHDDFPKELLAYESSEIYTQYKFGVLYVADGQTTEQEMFSNVKESELFKDFLTLLGEKIELKGWSKFKGGLDVSSDSTGKYSIYTEFMGYEIMFHVSTYLPFSKEDPQQIERKRHLGNDVTIIVFKEGTQKFDPSMMKSQFTHVYIVVEPFKKHHTIYYRLAVANKKAVPPYGPFLPDPPVFLPDKDFRDFLLTKLINSERATLYAPAFKEKMERTRSNFFREMVKKYFTKSSGSKKVKGLKRIPSVKKLGRSFRSLVDPQSEKGDKDIPPSPSKHKTSTQTEKSPRSADTNKIEKTRELRHFRKSTSSTNLIDDSEFEQFKKDLKSRSSHDDDEDLTATLPRLIICDKKNPSDRDMILFNPATMTLDDLYRVIAKTTNRAVASVELKELVLKDKHVAMLRDLDVLDVVYRE